MRTVSLSIETPRSLDAIDVNVQEGLRVRRVFKWFFYLGIAFIAVTGLFSPQLDGQVKAFLVIFGIPFLLFLVWLFFRSDRRRLRVRRACLANGRVEMATVTGHGRLFDPLKSSRNYSVTAALVSDPNRVGGFESPQNIHRDFPIGATVQALVAEGAVWLPAELGIHIETTQPEPPSTGA